MSRNMKLLAGFIGTLTFCLFVGGLSHGISSGFAGFWGGFPFMVIAIVVCAMALYDFWDECVRKK